MKIAERSVRILRRGPIAVQMDAFEVQAIDRGVDIGTRRRARGYEFVRKGSRNGAGELVLQR